MFSVSLCWAKTFNELVEDAAAKCAPFLKDCNDDCFITFSKTALAPEDLATWEKCSDKCQNDYDNCMEPDELVKNLDLDKKTLKKVLKQLNKVEKQEDGCEAKFKKSADKCAKKKGKSQTKCGNNTLQNYYNCMDKAKDMRQKLDKIAGGK